MKNSNQKKFLKIVSGWFIIASLGFPSINYADNEGKTIDAIAHCGPIKRKIVKIRPCYRKRHKIKRCKHRVRVCKKRKIIAAEPLLCTPHCDSNVFIFVKSTNLYFKCFDQLITAKQFAVDPLPPCFKIYVNDALYKANLHPLPEFEPRKLPTVHLFTRAPGCYIGCYSNNPDKSTYAVAPNIYMIGQIRVRGSYVGEMCVPENYETVDIRGERIFKELCSKAFSCVGNSCWAGPHTGAWFGLK